LWLAAAVAARRDIALSAVARESLGQCFSELSQTPQRIVLDVVVGATTSAPGSFAAQFATFVVQIIMIFKAAAVLLLLGVAAVRADDPPTVSAALNDLPVSEFFNSLKQVGDFAV
jgi:hypothetical protein